MLHVQLVQRIGEHRLGVLVAAMFNTPNGVEVPMPKEELAVFITRKPDWLMVSAAE